MVPDVIHASPWGRVVGALKRLSERLWDLPTVRLQTMAASLLVTFVAGIFGVALVVTALAAFSGDMPSWLADELQRQILAGNRSVELTLEYLVRWGIIDVLRGMLGQLLIIGGIFVGVLFIARLVCRSVGLLPLLFSRAMGRPSLQRIRLTRPLRVSAKDAGRGYLHQFDVHVDFVLRQGADTRSVIGNLSVIVPAVLKTTKDVVERLNAEISTPDIAKVMSRSAQKCDKRIRSVELRDVAYAIVNPETGDVMFTQNLPVVGP